MYEKCELLRDRLKETQRLKKKEGLTAELKMLKIEERACRKKLLKAYDRIHKCNNTLVEARIDRTIDSLYVTMRSILRKAVEVNKALGRVKWATPNSWHYKPII